MGKTVTKILDPGNIFGKDKSKAGMSMAGMMDPGGEIIEAITGSDKAKRIADPGDLLTSQQMTGDLPEPMEVPEIPSMADTSAAEAEEARKREAAKRGRASTILTSSAGGGLGNANVGAATLGGR